MTVVTGKEMKIETDGLLISKAMQNDLAFTQIVQPEPITKLAKC